MIPKEVCYPASREDPGGHTDLAHHGKPGVYISSCLNRCELREYGFLASVVSFCVSTQGGLASLNSPGPRERGQPRVRLDL